jgi:hypothetical protein
MHGFFMSWQYHSASRCQNKFWTQSQFTNKSRPGRQTGCRNNGHERRLFETGLAVKEKTEARRDLRSPMSDFRFTQAWIRLHLRIRV